MQNFHHMNTMNKGKIVGVDADMMQAVCDRLGMDLEIQNMDFDS